MNRQDLLPPEAAVAAARAARCRLAAMRGGRGGNEEHRALRCAHLSTARVAGALASAVAAVLLLRLLQEPLNDVWRAILQFWGVHLQLNVTLAATGNFAPPPGAADLPRPTAAEFVAVGGATALLYAATRRFADPLTPLKYLLRIVCFLQATALVFFLFAGASFPYTLAWHLDGVLGSGRATMLAAAFLTPLLEVLLGVPAPACVIHVLLMLGYFALLIPHELLLHAWLLQRGSMLLMPLLYLGFGALLHVVVFIALLSWMLSSAVPPA